MDLHLHHDFTINPDGSGRVILRWSAAAADGAPSPEEFVRSEVQQATGVEAWAEPRCAIEGERLVFSATAWFPDLSALRFHCQGFHCNVLDFTVTSTDDGEVVVATQRETKDRIEARPASGDGRITAKALAAEREKLAGVRGFLDGMFGGLRCTAVLRLPGRLAEPVRGERLADNAVQVEFEGQTLLDAIDRLLTDDQLMRKLMQSGDTSPDAALAVLGDQAPVSLSTTGGAAAQFDYAGEVAAAQAAYAMPVADGETGEASPPPPRPRQAGEPLAAVRVLGCKLVREANQERGLCPMGQNFPGWTLAVAGDFAQPVLSLDEVTWEGAVTDDGVDLTPAEEWDRRISFPRLTEDARTVHFDIDLPLPPPSSTGLQGLRGRVQCMVGKGEDEVDLGFRKLEADVEGTVHQAKLLRCQEEDGRWTLEIQLQVRRERIKAIRLVGKKKTVELHAAGYSTCNDESTLTYDFEGKMPAGARVVATMVTDLLPLDVPFELPAVDLLGRPR